MGTLLFLAGVFAIGFAWIAEHDWGMAPCALCLLERWPYRCLIGLGLLVILLPRKWSRFCLALSFLTLLASLGLSILHMGVEWGWWVSPFPECHTSNIGGSDLMARFANMPDRPNKPCDVPNYLFSWLPLSLTTLNGIFSLGLLAMMVVGYSMANKRHRKILR